MKRILYSGFFLLLFLSACKTDPNSVQEEKVTWRRTSNEVIIRQNTSPAKLNPLLFTTAPEREINNQIFSLLIDQDPYTFEYIPQLVKSLPVIEDITEGIYAGGEAFHFEIHENAVWSDGKPVTGHDFVFTIKAVFTPQVPTLRISRFLSLIKDIQVEESNPKKFTVFTQKKDVDALGSIGNATWVIPKHFYDPQSLLDHIPCKDFLNEKRIEELAETDEKLQTFSKDFVDVKYARNPEFILGSGPYKLLEWKDEGEIVLQKKENWWGDKLSIEYSGLIANPSRLIFKAIVDNVTAVAALRSEEIDAISNVDPNEFLSMRVDSTLSQIYDFETPPFFGYFFLTLNTRRAKLADKRVRQALTHLIDVDQIIEILFNGMASRLAAPVLPSSKLYNNDLKPYAFDVKKAKQLLKEAGWEDTNKDGIVDKELDGERVELKLEFLYVGQSDRYKNLALLCEETAKKAGVKFVLKGMESRTLRANTRNGEYDIAIDGRGWVPLSWHPKQNWHTSGAGKTGFGSVETDALIDKISVELDEEKRISMLKELQAIIYDECPEIYLINPVSRVVVHKRFEWTATPITPGYIPNHFKLKNSTKSTNNHK